MSLGVHVEEKTVDWEPSGRISGRMERWVEAYERADTLVNVAEIGRHRRGGDG